VAVTLGRPGFAVAVAAALLAVPSQAAAAEWGAPVRGWVTRGFDLGGNPFEAGRHRGADFAARPSAAVRAACRGRVLVAGPVGTSGRVVTIRCGPWRVTHLPLAQVTVRAGAVVDRGARIGSASASRGHDGLHLGVRREGDRFGYVDPLRLLSRHRRPPPPPGAVPPRGVRPPPLAGHAPAGTPAEPSAAGAGSSPVRAGAVPGLAPWPAWVGLGLLLAGAVGARAGRPPRRGRAALPHGSAQEVR